ncbi:molybdenum cofactor biosynthesis protein MoaE [Pseudarthrobacter phenanthrenivorans]|uniref:molybdenum cofactor biosynthesis protein MoaE n=1 Tax=Pseudarthrobacter phenanthrenivorans TaxID=361575 RepID=UPI00387E86FC
MSTDQHTSHEKIATGRQPIGQAFTVVHSGLSDRQLSVDVAIAAVESNTSGAVVSFSGVVRNHDSGKAVERLSYTAHPKAPQTLKDVLEAVAAEYSFPDEAEGPVPVRIWAAHRVGALRIGDAALVCAVAAGHRGQAFAVCAELVDRIKEEVPIWKEQFFSDGTVEWVGVGTAG